MLISSKFKDYYDKALGLSYSKDDIRYIRETKEVELKEIPKEIKFCSKSLFYHWPLGWHLSYVGFCGRIYPRLLFTTYLGSKRLDSGDAICWNTEQVTKIYRQCYTEKDYNSFIKPDNRWKFSVRMIEELFNYYVNFKTDAIFEEYKCPVFWIGWADSFDERRIKWANCLTINPNLHKLGFERVVGHYQAYQEISMYLGNMAFPNRPIPHVSDEDLLEAKGFNKFSFRKDKA